MPIRAIITIPIATAAIALARWSSCCHRARGMQRWHYAKTQVARRLLIPSTPRQKLAAPGVWLRPRGDSSARVRGEPRLRMAPHHGCCARLGQLFCHLVYCRAADVDRGYCAKEAGQCSTSGEHCAIPILAGAWVPVLSWSANGSYTTCRGNSVQRCGFSWRFTGSPACSRTAQRWRTRWPPHSILMTGTATTMFDPQRNIFDPSNPDCRVRRSIDRLLGVAY